METGERTFVTKKCGSRLSATVAVVRDRHLILRTESGEAAKIVKGSFDRTLASLEDIKVRTRRIRNFAEWRYLRVMQHPGLLKVGERVRDRKGDEGFLCEWLETPSPWEIHPCTSSMGEFLRCAILLSQAAGELHADNIIHGDITPSNVCLRGNTPVLVDYEMAVKAGQYLSDTPGQPSAVGNMTPACCSPEQVGGEPVFAQSDVYCLGLTMLSWVSGWFGTQVRGERKEQAISRCARAQYPNWRVVEARLDDERVIGVLRRAVTRNPNDRFRDGRAFAQALHSVEHGMTAEELSRPVNIIVT
jgi:serine/threonine protein kinase